MELLGWLTPILIGAAAAMRLSLLPLALLGAAALAAAVAHTVAPEADGVAIAWVLAALVAFGRLAMTLLARDSARFTDEETLLRDSMLSDLSKTEARHFIDQGHWINGQAGEKLTTEGEPVSHLFFITEGEAVITFEGKAVGRCKPGDLIGDVTALSGAPASATATLARASRFWCISASAFREYLDIHPSLRTVIERRINAALESKLRAANAALAAN